MKKINTDHLKELAETMDLIAQHQLDKASQIYYCVVKSVSNNQCTIIFNNKQYTVPYYGGKPTPNKTYAIFLPHNNMNESFVIGDGKDGGGGGSGSGIAIQPDPPTDGELVWIDTDDPGTTHIIPEIDDNNVSTTDTWSSQKIAGEIARANDSDDGYCKMPDGTLIQWGTTVLTSGSTNAYVSPINITTVYIQFPIPFASTDYRVFGSGKYSTGASTPIGQTGETLTSCGVHWWDAVARTFSTSIPLVIKWCAIGRWK